MSDLAYTDLRDRLFAGLSLLPDKPEETPESTWCALWHAAAGFPKSASLAAMAELPALSENGAAKLRRFVQQRMDGVPLAHITGRQRFMGMEMLAGPEALIPRHETELLAKTAVELAAGMENGHELRVIDLCTGSGNVALAVAGHLPSARVLGADISETAVDLARRNARYLGLQSRVEFAVGDLLVPFDVPTYVGAVDLITCNPPYIKRDKLGQMPGEIAAHEPSLAFDGGQFGVAIMLRLIKEAPRFLREGGHLACEVGFGQAPTMAKLMTKDAAFAQVRTVCDAAGVERVIVARR
jgi:release factor glutamine methyltransferase